MKKLLVSDYDGTFLVKDNIEKLKRNRSAIKRYINSGNIFAFASGRDFNSLYNEVKKHNIPYHYLICNNGTSIYNSNNEMLHLNLIAFAEVIRTINLLNRNNIIKNIKYIDALGNETRCFTDVAEIVCEINCGSDAELYEIKNKLHTLQVLNISYNGITSNDKGKIIIKEYADKSEAISFIAQKENILRENIYTIGNDFNDYNMLECYNGYKMCNSTEELTSLDVPSISSVHKLVKRIEG